MQFSSGATRLTLYAGLAKLISPQLNYGNMARFGTLFIVDDALEVQLGFNWFQETDLEADSGNTVVLGGTGYEVRFGYRF